MYPLGCSATLLRLIASTTSLRLRLLDWVSLWTLGLSSLGLTSSLLDNNGSLRAIGQQLSTPLRLIEHSSTPTTPFHPIRHSAHPPNSPHPSAIPPFYFTASQINYPKNTRPRRTRCDWRSKRSLVKSPHHPGHGRDERRNAPLRCLLPSIVSSSSTISCGS